MAGIVMCVENKKQQREQEEVMRSKGMWLASVKGVTKGGINLRMLTFYHDALRKEAK